MPVKRIMTIFTPKLAEALLNNNPSNRAMRPGRAEAYAADMAAGRWTECLAPIAIYDDGEVADGQHRLWAIVDSSTNQTFELVTGLDRAAGLNIDTGIPRTIVDNARISGTDPTLTTTLISVVRGIETGESSAGQKSPWSNIETLDMVAKHREPAEWVLHNGPSGRGIRNAPILSAIGRAWYVEADKERLAWFGQVLGKGFGEGNADSAAISLRNYLILRLQQGQTATSTGNWRDTFLKAQNAVRYFMLKKPLTHIKTITDESYPLANAGKVKPKFMPKTQHGRTQANVAKRVAKAKAQTKTKK